MTATNNISALRAIINEKISPFVTGDYVILDVPYHTNIGDILIWQGTEDFLHKFPYKCIYRASSSSFEYKEFPKDTTIFLLGGGNFGDIYYGHNIFRNKIIELYPNNKIVILPQTVYYNGVRHIMHDVKICRSHNNLFICARDKRSYDFLVKYGFSKQILLVPDMAFCISTEILHKYNLPAKKEILFFNRIDREKNGEEIALKKLRDEKYDMSDWPQYEQDEPMINHIREDIANGNKEIANDYAYNQYLPARLKSGIELISQYKKVYSNRLHGAILSILLEKDVTIIDNSYEKNSNFYDTWLYNTERIQFIRNKHPFKLKRYVKLQILLLFIKLENWKIKMSLYYDTKKSLNHYSNI